jgi:hypothetical protein
MHYFRDARGFLVDRVDAFDTPTTIAWGGRGWWACHASGFVAGQGATLLRLSAQMKKVRRAKVINLMDALRRSVMSR